MALNAQVLVVTQPGSTGQQTYDLADGFDPRFVIAWVTPQAADGVVDGAHFAWGMASYRGGAVQQYGQVMRSIDAGGDAAGDGEVYDDALLLMGGTAGAAWDLEIDFVSFGSGAGSNIVLDWVNLHTTGSILVNLAVVGGDDLTDAWVGSLTWTEGSSGEDLAAPSGFGHPDVMLFVTTSNDFVALNTQVNDVLQFNLGVAIREGAQGALAWNEDDGDTTMDVSVAQDNANALRVLGNASGSNQGTGKVDAESEWPTDGVNVSYSTVLNTSFASVPLGVAFLRFADGVDNVALLTLDNPTAGSPPVVEDTDVGFTPKLALFFGSNIPANASIDQTHADLGQAWVGAADADGNEAWAGFSQEDAAANADTYSYRDSGKAIQMHNPDDATPLLEADVSFVGTLLRRSFGDIDGTAREFRALVIGEPAGAQEIPVAQTAEDDAAQTAGRVKTRATGQPATTGAAQPVTARKTVAVAQAAETDAAQPIAWAPKHRHAGQALESDTAHAAAWAPKHRHAAQAAEADTANAAASRKTAALGQPAETGTAQPVTARKTITVGQAADTELAQPADANPYRRLINPAAETSAAQPATVNPQRRLAGQTLETDTAQPVTARKTRTLGQPAGAELAQPVVTSGDVVPVAQTSETDQAQPVTARKTRTVSQATESGAALPVTRATVQQLGPAADSVDGAWTNELGTTTDLYASIDETEPSDSDYIQSEPNPSASAVRLKLAAGQSPLPGDRILRWRVGRDQAGGQPVTMTLSLYQGGGDTPGAGTLVDEFVRVAPNTPTTYEETVTGAISDYADLYVEVEADS